MPTKKPLDQLRRRNSKVRRVLPVDGPDEAVPDWPWPHSPATAEERFRWDRWWRLPVAQLWHDFKLYDQVAHGVRLTVRASEAPNGTAGTGAAAQTQVRLWAESMGLTVKSLHVMGLTVGEQTEAPVADLDAYRKAVE